MIYVPINDSVDYEDIPPLPLDLLSEPAFPHVDFVRLMTSVSWDNRPNEIMETDPKPIAGTTPASTGSLWRFKWLAGVWRSWTVRAVGNRQR